MLPVSGAEQLKTSAAKNTAPHDLAERRVLQVGEPGPALALGQEQVPQALGAGLALQLLDEGDGLPAIPLVHLVVRSAARSGRRSDP